MTRERDESKKYGLRMLNFIPIVGLIEYEDRTKPIIDNSFRAGDIETVRRISSRGDILYYYTLSLVIGALLKGIETIIN